MQHAGRGSAGDLETAAQLAREPEHELQPGSAMPLPGPVKDIYSVACG
jgi:hypothetical protein